MTSTRARHIIKSVAAKHNLQAVDLLKPGRFAHIVKARREAMLELKELGWTSPQIADVLNVDHTTVLHHISPVCRERRLHRAREYIRRRRPMGAQA